MSNIYTMTPEQYDRHIETRADANHQNYCRALQQKYWELAGNPMADGEETMLLEEQILEVCGKEWL